MARPRSDIEPRILHAARERFLREGVDGASLRAIAQDAGTNIGMVYYYFPSKEDLFLGVVEEVYVGLLEDLEAALDRERPVRDRLERLFARLGALSEDEQKVVRLVIREALTSTDRLDRLIARFRRGHVPLLLVLIKDGFAAGVFDPALHPAQVLGALGALAGPAQLVMRLAPPRLGLPALKEKQVGPAALVELLLGGVGKR